MPPLIDKFNRVHTYLRISLTERCNLRCTYCMPEEGASSGVDPCQMKAGEIGRLAKIFASRLGINKIRFTGGEPLIRPDFQEIVSAVRSAAPGADLCVTTNGVHLGKNIDFFKSVNLRRINVSLDTLERGKFELISQVTAGHWDRTMEGLQRAISESFHVKINTVAMNHVNDDEFGALVKKFTKSDPAIELRFIELMPFSGNGKVSKKLFIDKNGILEKVKTQLGEATIAPVSSLSVSSSTGRNLFCVPGYVGRFGIISSVSDAFCGGCNRVRLTADGKVRNCLFSNENTESDLLGILRRGGSDDEIEAAIRGNVGEKFFAHGGRGIYEGVEGNRSMVRIGG